MVSFLITGHRSVYPSQVLSISKSPSLRVELGREIEEVQTTVNLRKKGVISRVLWLIKKIEETVNRIQQSTASDDGSGDDTHSVDKKQRK